MIKCDNDGDYNVVLIDFDLSTGGGTLEEKESEKVACVKAYHKIWFDEVVKGNSGQRDGYGSVWGGKDDKEHFEYRNMCYAY